MTMLAIQDEGKKKWNNVEAVTTKNATKMKYEW